MKSVDSQNLKDTGNLASVYIETGRIIQCEDMAGNEAIEKGFQTRPLRSRVIERFKTIIGDGENLPPIIVLREPDGDYVDKFHAYLNQHIYPLESIPIERILVELAHLRDEFGELILVYNGNTRLEAHRKIGKAAIASYIVKSDTDFGKIPKEELVTEKMISYENGFFWLLHSVLLKRIKNRDVLAYPRFIRKNNTIPSPETLKAA